MKVQVRDYQNKARLLIQALKKEGVSLVSDHANVLLIDFDGPVNPYPQMIQEAYEQGAEIVLYSHGAPVITAWDGIWKPGPLTRLYLAQSGGQKVVMNAYKYPHPIKTIGWHYCEQREFQPCADVKNILFAPEHPHSNGYMLAETRNLINNIFNNLLKLPFQLTVRRANAQYDMGMGIQRPGVRYQWSNMTILESVEAIDETDLIVSNPGTFASLAVARGKPVVMYGQDICPHDGYSDETLKYVKNWDNYRQFMRYPYDISNKSHKAIESIIRHAGFNEATEWRSRFIGESMKSEVLMDVLKGL